jgi:molybdopterin-binding protein
MQLSARNVLEGTVIDIRKGAVAALVKIELAGGQVVTSMVTVEAVEALGLAVGDRASAVIKATEVMLAR